MIRYDNVDCIKDPEDYKKVCEAVGEFMVYTTDILGSLRTDMNVTVDNGNVFFYSRKNAPDRYFVEVKPSTKTIKITLAGNDNNKEGG